MPSRKKIEQLRIRAVWCREKARDAATEKERNFLLELAERYTDLASVGGELPSTHRAAKTRTDDAKAEQPELAGENT
jgi:hypothetical protein